MTTTVTSLFETEQQAAAAANRLQERGVPRDRIDIWSTPHNLASLLEDKGMSRHDANAYADGVVNGGSVVIVTTGGEEVDHIVGLLDQEHERHLEERLEAERSDAEADQAIAPIARELAESSGTADGPATTSAAPMETHRRVKVQVVGKQVDHPE